MSGIWEGFLRGANALGGLIIANKNPLLKISVWVVGIVSLPLLGLFLLPIFLGLIASPLDLKQDLYALNRPVAFTFLDAKGEVVGRRGAAVGDRLRLEDMPPYLPAAFIAMEDRRFYEHHAVDPRGVVRALFADLKAGHVVAGGSTITEQTAKILFTNQERTFSRRGKALLDAAMLEKSLSKKQILELYLNRIYLGSGAYGVDGAARVYFGKSARDLTLAEAAMLATLTRAPSVFSPRRDLAAAQQRADVVLNTMVDTGAISERQSQDAHDHPASVVDRATTDARNYYLDAAREEALRVAASSGQALSGDLTVRTTLEPKLQDAARRTARQVIAKSGPKVNAHEAAVVMMKPDGAVVAMIGGVDYTESTFNRAIQAHRQPGSAFKPFVYLAALEAGISPWETRDDQPVWINGWAPTNFGGRSYGTITLADAIAHSVNTIAVSLAQEVGVDTVVEAAKRCGITSKLAPNASLALGTSEVTPLELTSAYAVFASGGLRVHPYMVTQVNGADGRVLFKRNKAIAPERVVATHVNRDLTTLLYGVVAHGTGGNAGLWDHEAAGKTGTTQDYHDAWFVGFTADYVTGVWVGNDDASPMKGVTGGTLPAQIWKTVMRVAEEKLPATPLDRSAPPETLDTEGLVPSGMNGLSADDEAAMSRAPQVETQDSAHQEKRKSTGSLFNWLFGSDDEKPPRTAPPPGDSGQN